VALKEGNSDVFESAGQLLRKLVAAGVDADCLNVSHLNMEFVASAAIVETIVALALDAGIELGEKSTDCAKISLIGHAENNGSSLTNAFVEILRREEIEILKTFTGPYAISGIVHKKDMVPAVQALHRNLFEN